MIGMTRIQRMKGLTQHHVNVLHIYCRLADMGMNKKLARHICEFIEFTGVYHLLYF